MTENLSVTFAMVEDSPHNSDRLWSGSGLGGLGSGKLRSGVWGQEDGVGGVEVEGLGREIGVPNLTRTTTDFKLVTKHRKERQRTRNHSRAGGTAPEPPGRGGPGLVRGPGLNTSAFFFTRK